VGGGIIHIARGGEIRQVTRAPSQSPALPNGRATEQLRELKSVARASAALPRLKDLRDLDGSLVR
jgi:hypothetical protein